MSDNPFVGTWKLVSSEMRTESGAVHYPLGEDSVGVMMFDQQGTLNGQLMRVGREKFASDDMMLGTPEEITAAYRGYVALWATYQFDEQNRQLRYVIDGALYPNWEGKENLRFYEFEGNRLTLRTPPFPLAGETTTSILIWERVC